MTLEELKSLMTSVAPVIRELVEREIRTVSSRVAALENRLLVLEKATKPTVRVRAGSSHVGESHDAR